MTPNCDGKQLDAYLLGDLATEEAALFESHLQVCPACREGIAEQQWIDGLLQSPTRGHLEQAPTSILDSARVSLTVRRRRAFRTACGLATAAALIVAAGWQQLYPHLVHHAEPGSHDAAIAQAPDATSAAGQEATFVSSAESIVVPVESPSADVTIVQVYPTTDTERRWQSEMVSRIPQKEAYGG